MSSCSSNIKTFCDKIAGWMNAFNNGEPIETNTAFNCDFGYGEEENEVARGEWTHYTVDTIDDLRNMTKTPPTVRVRGYYDKDGGEFSSHYYKKVDSGTDNGGTIIEAQNATYQLVYEGAVNVKWFGAKVNEDSTSAIQKALDNSKYLTALDGDTFIVTSLAVPQGIIFKDGQLDIQGDGSYCIVNRGNMTNIVINGENAEHDRAVYTDTDNPIFYRCKFINGYNDGIFTALGTSNKGLVKDCEFNNWGQVGNSYPIIVRGSYWNFLGNRFIDTGDGHDIRIGIFDGDDDTVWVIGTNISNNYFRGSEQVGVVLELNTVGTRIENNYFYDLAQAIKIEKEDNRVKDTIITGNTFEHIRITTAFNWRSLGLIAKNNIFKDSVGGVILHSKSTFEGNILYGIGDDSHPSVEAYSDQTDIIVSNNMIYDAPKYGISVNNNVNVMGNLIVDAVERAISISADGDANTIAQCNVSNNIIKTLSDSYGIVIGSSVETAVLTGNSIQGDGTPYSYSSSTRIVNGETNYPAITQSKEYNDDTTNSNIALPYWAEAVKFSHGTDENRDIDTISTDETHGGKVIMLRPIGNTSRVTLKSGGNIETDADIVLDSNVKYAMLYLSSTKWFIVSTNA